MKLIKLTDENDRTYGGMQWGENVTNTVEWNGQFCSPGCIHVYQDSIVAMMLNPIHANFQKPHVWEAEGEILASDRGLKFGVAALRTVRRLPTPRISTVQRVAFAIYCSLKVYRQPAFRTWADGWLSGKDRTANAAYAARADAAAYVAARAARADAAAYVAARAAAATYAAAHAAAVAAAHAAAVAADLDFTALAAKAMEVK